MLLEFCKKILGQKMPLVLEDYIQVQDSIDTEQTQLLRNLFDKMDQFELQSINVPWKGLILDGLTVIPTEKKKQELISEEHIQQILQGIRQKMGENSSDIQNAYYIKSFITFVQKLNYFTYIEQFLFDCLFKEMKLEGKKIEEVKSEERQYVIYKKNDNL